MQSIADFAELSWRRLPEQGRPLENLRFLRRLRKAQATEAVLRFPQRVAGMDEYPAVPFYTLDGQSLYYDSSGLAQHLDKLGHTAQALLPESGAERFLCRLIDEAFDEFGLYMVHHIRWVTSARTNVMGEMTAREMGHWLPAPVRRNIARRLSQRQTRRLPYLFSVAPPARAGFPPTHELLDQAWRSYLAAMEQQLTQQPYLLGERFTLADASAYGQLGMNLVDGRAAQLMQEFAPQTYRWLCAIRDGEHRGSRGQLQVSGSLDGLIECIGDTFIPLMQQNAAAWEGYRANGQSCFNETAFDRGEALYDGELMGKPFRAVAKSFQVVVWSELLTSWHELVLNEQADLLNRYPVLESLADAPAPA
jgi:glutathione S-transferase